MYAGYIVERASVDDLYDDPRHFYTQGLLGSLPRLDIKTHEKLKSIEGMPPDLVKMIKGCPFAPRCEHVMERCIENPPLFPVGPEHYNACWLSENQGEK
jgi:oligopeptide/dipeptide ABC transporter ATP-binding protein